MINRTGHRNQAFWAGVLIAAIVLVAGSRWGWFHVLNAHAASSLAAAYGFGEGTGTAANDSSGNGNAGVLVGGATWTVAGKYGSGISLDGSTGYISVNNSASLSFASGTLEAWLNLAAVNRWHGIFAKGSVNDDGHSYNYGIEITDANRISCFIGNGTSVNTLNSAATVVAGQFFHLACTWDGANISMYVNGLLDSTKAQTIVPRSNTAPLLLGKYGGNVDHMSGTLDEVRLYSRALSATEIQTDMNTPVVQDTQPPTVAITNPPAASTVSGVITVTANATDNIGVAGVQFLLDGVNLGAEVTSSPFSVLWNTATALNALHTLTARARDTSGNQATSSPVSITVFNPPKLVIQQPAQNASIASTTVNIVYTGQGDTSGVDSVIFQLDANPAVLDQTFNGSFQLTNVAPGSHTLSGYLVHMGMKIAGSDATPISFTTVSPDTTPPTVSITNPSANSTVSGTVTVTASASDNVGVVGVQFMLDGANLGAEVSTSPYSVVWDTTGVANGSHTIVAKARDAAANVGTSSPVVVTVSNINDPSVIGAWSGPVATPMVAVHGVLLNNGKVLAWEMGSQAQVWDIPTNTFTATPDVITDVFCGGHVTLTNGNPLILGGGGGGAVDATNHVDAFAVANSAWSGVAPMNLARWYPTATVLGDGRVLATSGASGCGNCYVGTPEIYNPKTNTWTSLSSANNPNTPNYPFMFVVPDGRVAFVGGSEFPTITQLLDVNTQTWTTIDPSLLDGTGAVMYAPGKILKAGSAGDAGGTGPSSAAAYTIDFNQPLPGWHATASMAFPRGFVNLTALPDGTVAATGGDTTTRGTDVTTAVKAAEIWSPVTGAWTTMASMQTPRLYHSIGLLLPDGRVLVSGGGANAGIADQLSAEFFSPPYLFKGPRPTITASPAVTPYGSQFFVGTPDAANIASVSFIKTSAVTHFFNQEQRFIGVNFQQTSGGILVNAPADANLATPGVYMMFLVSNTGVPSIAAFITLPSSYDDVTPPTAPGNLAGVGGVGTVNLTWSASTDNVEVARYNIYRDTVSGFVPVPGNQIGHTAGTSFADAGLVGGTYYYVVTAQDLAGNASGPSNQAAAVVTGDTVPPTVSMSAPPDGSSVSGTITVSANASDDTGVAGVQFLLDGQNLGTEVTSTPYSITWNTAPVSSGSHSLAARARDLGNNLTTSMPITVNVLNGAPAGLVLGYPLNEGAGTKANDDSGNLNTATLNGGATWTLGKYGNAVSFDGSSGFLSANNSATLGLGNGTIAAWINLSSVNRWHGIIAKGNVNDDGHSYNYGMEITDSNVVTCFIGNGSSQNTVRSADTIPAGQFTHVACTWDGTNVKAYVNGVLDGTTAQTLTPITNSSPLYIGQYGGNVDRMLGTVDEVRIYNRALTSTEIQTVMGLPLQ